MSEPFIAEIRIFPYTYAPRSWARCDGQLIGIVQNTAMFSIVGTAHGGDGRTTFGLPNMQARAPLHSGQGPGLSYHPIGEFGGTLTLTLQELHMPPHTHQLKADTDLADTDANDPSNNVYSRGAFQGTQDNNPYSQTTTDKIPLNSQALGLAAGGGGAHENQQPFLGIQFCIAIDGIFPPRS